MSTKVLLVGESWTTSETHYKGFDQFGSVHFHTGATPLLNAMKDSAFDIDYMTAHDAAEGFPFEMEGLAAYDIIILSDIGANTFLLPPDVWLRSKCVPNRLRLLKDWVAQGGNLIMMGGYFSFQGIDGKAAGAARRSRTRCRSRVIHGTTGWKSPKVPPPRCCLAITPPWLASPATGQRSLGSMRWCRATGPPWWRASPKTKVGIRCWWSAHSGRGALRSGPRISDPIGCRRNSASGRATNSSGATCWAGLLHAETAAVRCRAQRDRIAAISLRSGNAATVPGRATVCAAALRPMGQRRRSKAQPRSPAEASATAMKQSPAPVVSTTAQGVGGHIGVPAALDQPCPRAPARQHDLPNSGGQHRFAAAKRRRLAFVDKSHIDQWPQRGETVLQRRRIQRATHPQIPRAAQGDRGRVHGQVALQHQQITSARGRQGLGHILR